MSFKKSGLFFKNNYGRVYYYENLAVFTHFLHLRKRPYNNFRGYDNCKTNTVRVDPLDTASGQHFSAPYLGKNRPGKFENRPRKMSPRSHILRVKF